MSQDTYQPAGRVTNVVIATSVMLTFISFWRAAAIVLNDLGSSAFYVGGMGRFYRETMARHGEGETVERVKSEWDAGRGDAAAHAVTDALLDAVTVRGTAERCLSRLAEYRAAGADLPLIALPAGASLEQTERTIRALGALT